ncbi:hypothetical protein [Nocardia brasiliensis]|uniref:hypothetical protein n=1 Tax=Nocardia brasiliensis TaxID=37326 RepID=UPI0024556E29|nr:hypothetical protein [Nocardia brasiliensis]
MVEVAAGGVGGVLVERVWIGDQVEGVAEDAGSDFQFGVGIGEAGFGTLAFGGEIKQHGANLGLWHRIVGG